MHWGWIWDLHSSLTKPGPGSSSGLWLMCFQASVTSCCTWHPGHSWLPQAKQEWLESLTAAPPHCAWAVPWHHTAPFPSAAQDRGARLGHGVPWQGWLAQPAQVAPSQRGERTGKERWLTVHALLALLLRQQGHTQPLAWGRLLRHGLVSGEIHCVWRCSFPLHFYLVFLGFLLAPNASGDSTVPAESLLCRNPEKPVATERGCDSNGGSFGAFSLCLSMFVLSQEGRCWGWRRAGILTDLSEVSEMDPVSLLGRAVGSKQQRQESNL